MLSGNSQKDCTAFAAAKTAQIRQKEIANRRSPSSLKFYGIDKNMMSTNNNNNNNNNAFYLKAPFKELKVTLQGTYNTTTVHPKIQIR